MKQLFNKKSITLAVILLISFTFLNTLEAQNKSNDEQTYIKIEVKGMACPYCAYGMEKELKNISGVDKVTIELKEGLAYISTPTQQRPSKESLEKIIKDAGFTVGEIEFQKKPFINEN